MKASFFWPQICVNHILQDVQMIQKRKEKEIDELVHLEQIKTKYEHELEISFSELMKISDLLQRSKEDNRFEETHTEAETELAITVEMSKQPGT